MTHKTPFIECTEREAAIIASGHTYSIVIKKGQGRHARLRIPVVPGNNDWRAKVEEFCGWHNQQSAIVYMVGNVDGPGLDVSVLYATYNARKGIWKFAEGVTQ